LKTKRSDLAEEKVNLAINITDTCVRICTDSVRDSHPMVKEEDLLECVRERIMYLRRRKREV
jgi:hypothetical protein